MRGGVKLVCALLLMPSMSSIVELTDWNADGSTFPLEVSTNKYSYNLGERVFINVSNVGNETITFPYPFDTLIVDSVGHVAVDTIYCWPRPAMLVEIYAGMSLQGWWDQDSLTCDPDGNPIFGGQVPAGVYSISRGMDTAQYGDYVGPIWDSVWIEIEPVESGPGPIADAGPDQTVNEGYLVSFDGSNSTGGGGAGLWEDEFDDTSLIDFQEDVTVASGYVALEEVSFYILEDFDTFSGFQLQDDQTHTNYWWDSADEVLRWHSDIEDPQDTWEKLVKFTPFEVTERFDVIAKVDYLYTNAQSKAEVYPLIFMEKNVRRVTGLFGPTHDSIDFSVYGGDPTNDHHALRFYDSFGYKHEPLNRIHDEYYNIIIQASMAFDSQTGTLTTELMDENGVVLGTGSTTVPSFTASKFGVGAIGRGFSGTADGFSDNMVVAAYGYESPGMVESVSIAPSGLADWMLLDFSTDEPTGTDIKVDVLDEFGSPIITGVDAGDCPFDLSTLDPVAYPEIALRATLTTTWNATPRLYNWGVSYSSGGNLSFAWDFDASVDSDGDGDFTNDVEATGPAPSHTFYDDGIYTVTLTVTDDSGQSDSDTCVITVLNVAPIPEWTSRSSDGTILSPPYPEGMEILFEATVYDPGIYDTFTYDWDFGDGTVLLDAGPSVTHTYGDNDLYVVVLTVTDDDGGVGIDDTPPLETTNENPVASISMPFCTFSEGTWPCSPIGEFTDPGWLDTHAAVWNYGDGTYETAVLTEENDPPDATGWNITSHIYGDNGAYTITFTVMDDDGGVGTATAEAHVINLPPKIEMIAPAPVNEGENLMLDLTVTDPGSDDIFLTVDWGDGTSETMTYFNDGVGPDPPNSGEGIWPFTITVSLTHVYGDNGNFPVQVTAEDDDGDSVQESTVVEVLNLPPEIILLAVPVSVNEGEKFSVVAEAADPGSDDIELSWTFELGPSVSVVYYNDGMGPDPQISPWGTFPFTAEDTATHTYGDNGLYSVTIVATDDDGGTSTMIFVIDVVNLAPSVDIGGPYRGDENSPIDFTATAVDPGSDDLTFIWDWGDGTTEAMAFYNDGVSDDPLESPWGTYPFSAAHSASHTWGDNGNFTITLTVMDDDGGMTTSQTVVVVDNVNPEISNVSFDIFYNVPRTQGYWNFQCTDKLPSPDHVGIQQGFVDYISTHSRVFRGISAKDEVCGYLGTLDSSNMTQKAMQQLMALWLNVASGKLNLSSEMFVPQLNMIMDLWELIKWIEDTMLNDDEDNLETAKDLADDINNGILIPYAVVAFWATASDPGSDDLTFTWDWGDGTWTGHIHYNDGVGPDPYPSPEVNPITVTDTAVHSYASAGSYTITLTVTDDDSGSSTVLFEVTI